MSDTIIQECLKCGIEADCIEGVCQECAIKQDQEPEPKTNIISIRVLGDPKAQKRHRTYTKDKLGNVLKHPIRTDPSAGDKANFLSLCRDKAPLTLINTPVDLALMFNFPRPKSHYGTGRNEGVLKDRAPKHHIQRPDVDNLAKCVLDALNGIFWRDDTIIYRLMVVKRWSERGSTLIDIRYNDEKIVR